MKIPKCHAVNCTDFILIFLEDGYYPMDELELGIIRKVLGFGQYHGMVKADTSKCPGAKEVGKLKKTARLDLTADEASAILDMFTEVDGNDMLEWEMDFFNKTFKYLLKEF